MADITIHQHYVWRGYLRAWTHDDTLFCLREKNNLFPVNIMKVAQENLFYEFKECTDEEIYVGYHFAKNSCNQLIELYEKMNNELRLLSVSNDDKKAKEFFDFLKDFEERLINFPLEERLKKSLYSLYSKDFSFIEDEGSAMEFYHAISEQYCRTKKTKENIKTSIEMLGNPNIRPHNVWILIRHSIAFNIGLHLYTNKYQLCLLENLGGLFITTDQPLINIHANCNFSAPEEFELYYPITPKLALIISKQPSYPHQQTITIDNLEANKWNRKLLEMSHNQIFSDRRDSLEAYIVL